MIKMVVLDAFLKGGQKGQRYNDSGGGGEGEEE